MHVFICNKRLLQWNVEEYDKSRTRSKLVSTQIIHASENDRFMPGGIATTCMAPLKCVSERTHAAHDDVDGEVPHILLTSPERRR